MGKYYIAPKPNKIKNEAKNLIAQSKIIMHWLFNQKKLIK